MSFAADGSAWTGPLLAEDARALNRLLRRTLGRGFRLVVIEVATPRLRQRLVEWLRAEVGPLDGEVLDLDVTSLPGENLWSELGERLDHGEVERQRLVLALHGFQEAAHGEPDERAGLYRQLNVQRDLFVRDLGCSWVLLIDPYGSRKLQSIAPDFCDFASLWIRAPGAGVEFLGLGHRPPITAEIGRSVGLDVDETGPDLLRRAAEAIAAEQFVKARDLLSRFDLATDADDEHQVVALLLRGRLELRCGNLDAARSVLEQALARSLARGDQAKDETAGALHLLGDVLVEQGQYPEARSAFERALEIEQEIHGTQEHPDIAELLTGLAQVHAALGDDEEARRLYARTLEFGEAPLRSALLRDDLDEARRILEQALEAEERSSATKSSQGGVLRALASVLHGQGELDAARRQMERSLELLSDALGTERHPIFVTSLRELGSIMRKQSDLDGARQTLERSLELAAQVFGTQLHPEVAATLRELALVIWAQGASDDALRQLERAREIQEQVFGADHLRVVEILVPLAMVLANLGKLDEAAATYERALNISTRFRGPDHVSTCTIEVALARLLLEQGNSAQAERLLHHARPILAAALGLANALVQQADALLEASARTSRG